MSEEFTMLLSRDGFFVKDGRGWYSSATGRGHTLSWPRPSTIRGALCTGIGYTAEREQERRWGDDDWRDLFESLTITATFPLRRKPGARWQADGRMWPAPGDALYDRESRKIRRLVPQKPTGGGGALSQSNDPCIETLWHPGVNTKAKPIQAPAWWTEADFVSWLAGDFERVPWHGEEVRRGLSCEQRTDVRLVVDRKTGTASDGQLFSLEIVEPLRRRRERDHSAVEEWGLTVRFRIDDRYAGASTNSDAVFLGGKKRLAFRRPCTAELFEANERVLQAFDERAPRGIRLCAVTPLYFERGWLPDGLRPDGHELRGKLPGLEDEVVLRSAIVPRPVHVSGWDMAKRQPKPTARLVKPGAVYFFEKYSGRAFSRGDALNMWLASIGGRTDDGYGTVVPGIWSPEEAGI